MNKVDTDGFAEACANLIDQVAAIPSLADAIVDALASGELTSFSGPVGISNVLRGAPGSHALMQFLHVWRSGPAHLSAQDVTTMVRSGLACYRLAQGSSHIVDAVCDY